jgi:hypothetical protein
MLHVGTRISALGHIEELTCVRSPKNPSLYEVWRSLTLRYCIHFFTFRFVSFPLNIFILFWNGFVKQIVALQYSSALANPR